MLSGALWEKTATGKRHNSFSYLLKMLRQKETVKLNSRVPLIPASLLCWEALVRTVCQERNQTWTLKAKPPKDWENISHLSQAAQFQNSFSTSITKVCIATWFTAIKLQHGQSTGRVKPHQKKSSSSESCLLTSQASKDWFPSSVHDHCLPCSALPGPSPFLQYLDNSLATAVFPWCPPSNMEITVIPDFLL